jgi:hypothetical protein
MMLCAFGKGNCFVCTIVSSFFQITKAKSTQSLVMGYDFDQMTLLQKSGMTDSILSVTEEKV